MKNPPRTVLGRVSYMNIGVLSDVNICPSGQAVSGGTG